MALFCPLHIHHTVASAIFTTWQSVCNPDRTRALRIDRRPSLLYSISGSSILNLWLSVPSVSIVSINVDGEWPCDLLTMGVTLGAFGRRRSLDPRSWASVSRMRKDPDQVGEWCLFGRVGWGFPWCDGKQGRMSFASKLLPWHRSTPAGALFHAFSSGLRSAGGTETAGASRSCAYVIS